MPAKGRTLPCPVLSSLPGENQGHCGHYLNMQSAQSGSPARLPDHVATLIQENEHLRSGLRLAMSVLRRVRAGEQVNLLAVMMELEKVRLSAMLSSLKAKRACQTG